MFYFTQPVQNVTMSTSNQYLKKNIYLDNGLHSCFHPKTPQWICIFFCTALRHLGYPGSACPMAAGDQWSSDDHIGLEIGDILLLASVCCVCLFVCLFVATFIISGHFNKDLCKLLLKVGVGRFWAKAWSSFVNTTFLIYNASFEIY